MAYSVTGVSSASLLLLQIKGQRAAAEHGASLTFLVQGWFAGLQRWAGAPVEALLSAGQAPAETPAERVAALSGAAQGKRQAQPA